MEHPAGRPIPRIRVDRVWSWCTTPLFVRTMYYNNNNIYIIIIIKLYYMSEHGNELISTWRSSAHPKRGRRVRQDFRNHNSCKITTILGYFNKTIAFANIDVTLWSSGTRLIRRRRSLFSCTVLTYRHTGIQGFDLRGAIVSSVRLSSLTQREYKNYATKCLIL